MSNLKYKTSVAKAFDSKVIAYDRHAKLQMKCAERLAAMLPDSAPVRILEVGCGTGFLTKLLQRRYPEAHITAIDIAGNMVGYCHQKFTGFLNVDFALADGEFFETAERYDLIVSNLSVQWFENPLTGLENLQRHLRPQGHIFYSTIGAQSFQEWQSTLAGLNLPQGLVARPAYEGIIEEQKEVIRYKSAWDFLKDLKNIGTHQHHQGYRPLSPARLKQACARFDEAHQGRVTWHILYGEMGAR